MNGEWENLQREVEKLLGYSQGAFNPAEKFHQDQFRVMKALGFPSVLLQDLMSPEQLRDRILAGFEQPARKSALNLQKAMYQLKPPFTNGGRRY